MAKELCRDVVGRFVRLTREIQTGIFGGGRCQVGSRWRVVGTHRGRFSLEAVDDAGVTMVARTLRAVMRPYFEIETTN